MLFFGRRKKLMVEAILYYQNNNNPLSKQGVLDLVQEYIQLMPVNERKRRNFKPNDKRTFAFCNVFLKRNGLVCKSVQQMEGQRVEALTKETTAGPIARVQAAW